MSEPWIPIPPPEEDSYNDPLPARCPHQGCNIILANVRWTGAGEIGTCPRHGQVQPRYKISPDPEKT